MKTSLKLNRKSATTIICVALIGIAACGSQKFNKVRTAGKFAVPLITKLAVAYGAPYANLFRVFADMANPKWNASGKYGPQGEYAINQQTGDQDQEEYPDEEQYPDDGEYPDEEQYPDDGDVDPTLVDSENIYLLVEADIIRESDMDGRISPTTVMDGDTLTARDNYKVQISCNTDCWVYIAQMDATGKVDPILPSGFVNVSNPLNANELYSLPEENNWFHLDDNQGIEQIYFIVSQTPRPDIESIFTQFESINQKLVQKSTIKIEKPFVLTRGIQGIRAAKEQIVTMRSGKNMTYEPTQLESLGGDVVITRWFNHE